MRKVTGKVKAWLSPYRGPDSLFVREDHDANEVVSVPYLSNHDLSKGSDPYTLIGEAEVTLTIYDDETVVGNKVKALENSIVMIQAETEKRLTQIREQINSLLAITFKPGN